jgi:hypothetical protein
MEQHELEMAIRPASEGVDVQSRTKSIDGHVSVAASDGKKRSKLQMAAIITALFVRSAFLTTQLLILRLPIFHFTNMLISFHFL